MVFVHRLGTRIHLGEVIVAVKRGKDLPGPAKPCQLFGHPGCHPGKVSAFQQEGVHLLVQIFQDLPREVVQDLLGFLPGQFQRRSRSRSGFVQQEHESGGPSVGNAVQAPDRFPGPLRCPPEACNPFRLRRGQAEILPADDPHSLAGAKSGEQRRGLLPADENDADAWWEEGKTVPQHRMECRVGRNFLVVVEHDHRPAFKAGEQGFEIPLGKYRDGRVLIGSQNGKRLSYPGRSLLRRETEVVEEGRGIGVALFQPDPQAGRTPFRDVAAYQCGLPRARRAGYPHHLLFPGTVDEAEQPFPGVAPGENRTGDLCNRGGLPGHIPSQPAAEIHATPLPFR